MDEKFIGRLVKLDTSTKIQSSGNSSSMPFKTLSYCALPLKYGAGCQRIAC